MKYSQCEACATRAAWMGVGISLFLALVKYYIGWVGGSAGVVAAGLHSTICMVSSASILFTQYFARKGPDEKFPYGYGKFEFVVSATVNFSILVVMGIFFTSNIRVLLNEIHHIPHITAGVIAATSAITNEAMFRYFRCVGTEMNSPTITATAWAVRSNALTSFIVLLSVIGTTLGIRHLDPVVAIGITLVLFKIVGGNLIHSIRGLMDYSHDSTLPVRIRNLVSELPNVLEITNVKTRSMGQLVKVDLELRVDPNLSVEDTDKIEEKICKLLHQTEQKLGDITVGFVAI